MIQAGAAFHEYTWNGSSFFHFLHVVLFAEVDYDINSCANYAQTECQFRYCGTAIPFLTVRSTAR